VNEYLRKIRYNITIKENVQEKKNILSVDVASVLEGF
jgi:hypothetical protein